MPYPALVRPVLLAPDGAYETSLPGIAREQASRWLRSLAEERRAEHAPERLSPFTTA